MTIFAMHKLMNYFKIEKPSQLYYQLNKINDGSLPEVFQFGSNAFNKKARGQPFSTSTLNIIDMYKPGILDELLHPLWLALDTETDESTLKAHPIISDYLSSAVYKNHILIQRGVNQFQDIWHLDRHVNLDSLASALFIIRQSRHQPWYYHNVQSIICGHLVALCSSNQSLYQARKQLLKHVYDLFRAVVKPYNYDGFPTLDCYEDPKYITYLSNHLLDQIEESRIFYEELDCAKFRRSQRITKAQFIYNYITTGAALNPFNMVKNIKNRRSPKHYQKYNLKEFVRR
ncbi:MAG: hypothetical protein HWE16_02635 [Gammaproteobacteria bacterium]|nr:hypothetical protein [Gammaproteobacteria bacterium]